MVSGTSYAKRLEWDELLHRGSSGERLVAMLLKLLGHDVVFNDDPRRGHRRTDLRCRHCGLGVEVKVKHRPQVALSDSPRRPMESEHEREHYLAIVSGYGVWFFRFGDIFDRRAYAERRMNRFGEPYLVFPRGSLPAAAVTRCPVGGDNPHGDGKGYGRGCA